MSILHDIILHSVLQVGEVFVGSLWVINAYACTKATQPGDSDPLYVFLGVLGDVSSIVRFS